MEVGKEKGFVLYDDVNGLLAEVCPSGREFEDLLSDLDSAGVEILEEPKLEFDKKSDDGDDFVDLELAQDISEKTNDPVRMYLREMGTVPLLTREGEIELAKRNERGQWAVRKALSRSPLVIREILQLGDDLRRATVNIRDILVLSEFVITDDDFSQQRDELQAQIAEIEKYYKKSQQFRQKLQAVPRSMKPKQHRSLRWSLSRTMVQISAVIRKISFGAKVRHSLADRLPSPGEELKPLEREIARIQRRIEEPAPPGTADPARTIRITVHMIETINKLVRTQRQLQQELGREPTTEELSVKMELPVGKVRKVLRIAQEPISLETPVGEEEESHLGDFIVDRRVVSPSEAVINLNLREQTAEVLKTLSPREEKIIKMRFGLQDGSEHTLEEVGQHFAVTRERIRQIEAKALRKLRHPSRSHRLRAFLDTSLHE